MVVTTNLYLQKKFSDYIVACELELEEHGSHVIDAHIILCNIASSEYELELYRKCIKTCHRVLDLSPNCIRAHFLQLKSLVKLGKDDLCVKLSDIILNDSSGRFVLEDVNIILQIQDFVESVKLRNFCLVNNKLASPEVPIVNHPTTSQHSVFAESSSMNTETANAVENVKANKFCHAMNSADVKCLSSPRNIIDGSRGAFCNEPVEQNFTTTLIVPTENKDTIASATQRNTIEFTKNVPFSKVQSDFTTGRDKNENVERKSSMSTAVIVEAHSPPPVVAGQQRVLSNADTEGNNEDLLLTAAVSAVKESTTSTSSRFTIPLSISDQVAVSADTLPVSAVSSVTARARGSNSQHKKSRKPVLKDAVALFSPISTSSSATPVTNFAPLPSSFSLSSPSLSSSSSPASTAGSTNDSISKTHLEGYLSNCLTNEDALVTRTLLQSVRSNLCCAYGEDVVDDMIAYGYLKVNTGELQVFFTHIVPFHHRAHWF